ncbi:MAG: DUF6653 family protein [Pseudomonadota bacterium]
MAQNWTAWIAGAMRMDEATWARHANPWSAWTRLPILPAIVVVLLLRDTLGVATWVLLMLPIIWVWLNPRAFPPPATLDAWVSRAVMGDKLWVERDRRPIPQAHAAMAQGLSLLQAPALVPLVWGIWAKDAPLALTATALVIAIKFWFLDRMVWLYDTRAATEDDAR